jgi:hypothetical protein
MMSLMWIDADSAPQNFRIDTYSERGSFRAGRNG